MKYFIRLSTVFLVLFSLAWNALPCGPSYVEPLFKYEHAPENPYENFAAGRLGIVLPTMRRHVLFAAYRYINGGGFTPDEQKALVEVWNADFKNEDYRDDDVSEAVKAWIEKRRDIVGKEEKIPEIYVERNYGGYDFFPNCTKNAFETAVDTLSDRISSHGSDSRDVRSWLDAQDAVFHNCASGKQTPAELPPGAAEWLQKDRAYQIAAARFYSLDYEEAKERFDAISLDFESPWQETAAYLVARTLIRQASLTEDPKKAEAFYIEAEDRLNRFASSSGKFTSSADGLVGLIKYRLRPKERVRELANKLAYQGGGSALRQDLIDYTWLLDKFEAEAYAAEEERRKPKPAPGSNVSNAYTGNVSSNEIGFAANAANSIANAAAPASLDEITIYLATEDYKQSWRVTVKADSTDEEAIAAAEAVTGFPLTDKMKARVRDSRRDAFVNRFSQSRQSGYEGRYVDSKDFSISVLPEFLRLDELTDWLFIYQTQSAEAYLYSLNRFRQTNSDLWLMTAISKADRTSAELPRIIEAASRTAPSSPAYPTIAYHLARVYIAQGRNADAKKLLDEVFRRESDLPISTVNRFAELRMSLGDSLDDFLRYALRRPFAFGYGASSGSIDDFIEENKKYYDPEYHKEGREAYDREVEEQFRIQREWQDRLMFDYETTEVMNQHFPQSVLLETQRSAALPDYMRSRFATVIWVRSVLLGDHASAAKIAPAFAAAHPGLEPQLAAVKAAKTDRERDTASLYLLLKNPMLSPYLEYGIGPTENVVEEYYSQDWWCTPYDQEYDDRSDSYVDKNPRKPAFLTAAQSQAAQNERKRLKDIGDAPEYFANRVKELLARSPGHPQIPEMLYIAYSANGWRKYSCGGNIEVRNELSALLRRHFPNSEWARRMAAEEAEQNQ